jgi:hypothetical protein
MEQLKNYNQVELINSGKIDLEKIIFFTKEIFEFILETEKFLEENKQVDFFVEIDDF